MKIARRYFHERGEPRTGFVATQNSFHGRTYGALSVTGQPNLHQGFTPLLPDVSYAPFPIGYSTNAPHSSTTSGMTICRRLKPRTCHGPGQRKPVSLSHSRTNCVWVRSKSCQSCGNSSLNWLALTPPGGGGTSARSEL